MTAVYLRRDHLVLELIHFDRPGNPGFRERAINEPGLTHLSFTVPDLDEVLSRVAELGGQVLDDTHVGAAVFVRDPDGQLVELIATR